MKMLLCSIASRRKRRVLCTSGEAFHIINTARTYGFHLLFASAGREDMG